MQHLSKNDLLGDVLYRERVGSFLVLLEENIKCYSLISVAGKGCILRRIVVIMIGCQLSGS